MKTSPASADSSLTARAGRSEEHTSELQSRLHLVCRLLLEKKKKKLLSMSKCIKKSRHNESDRHILALVQRIFIITTVIVFFLCCICLIAILDLFMYSVTI